MPGRWSKEYDGNRLRVIRETMMIAGLLEYLGSAGVMQIRNAYANSVGTPPCAKTFYRYLHEFEKVGIAEKRGSEWEWVGWPNPIDPD